MVIDYRSVFILVIVALATSCVPKEQVVFKAVKNLTVDMDGNGQPVLRGEAVFFNPNKVQVRLKEIQVSVMVDNKNAAFVDQEMDLLVPRVSDFTVPIEAKLELKEFGLLDTVLGFLGGKTYKVQLSGFLRIKVHQINVKIPVTYNEEVNLNR